MQLGELLISVGAQFDLGVGHLRQSGLRQPDFKFDRRLCRVDAEIGERRMPHIVGHEGEEPEHESGGKAVPDDVADTAISTSKIDGQNDGNRERGGDAGKPGHQHPEPAVRAVVGKKAGALANHSEKRGHGVAGKLGRMDRALQEWGRKIIGTEITGTDSS